VNDERGSPSEGNQRADAPGVCSNNHALGPGEQFCGKCGAPRVDDGDPSGKNGTKGSREPPTPSQGGIDPSRKGRGIWTLGVVLIVALAAVAITALVMHSSSRNSSATSPKPSKNPPTTQPATSTSVTSTTVLMQTFASQVAPFVGGWSSHGIGITIDSSGAGSGGWRTYLTCSDSPTLCDPVTPSTLAGGQAVSTIHDGGAATFTIQSVSPSTVAHATSNSNQPTTFPSGEIELSLIANDELVVTSPSTRVSMTLCGPAAPIACFGA
jgi:hypothetical protein